MGALFSSLNALLIVGGIDVEHRVQSKGSQDCCGGGLLVEQHKREGQERANCICVGNSSRICICVCICICMRCNLEEAQIAAFEIT